MKSLNKVLYGPLLAMVLSLVVGMGGCVGCAVNFVMADKDKGVVTREGDAAMAPFAMTVIYCLLVFFVSLLVFVLLGLSLPRKKE
jgi:hypothetical protein